MDNDGISWFRVLFAASTVLALLGLLAIALRAFAARGYVLPVKGRAQRLKIIESLSLDTRRRLVIIACDGDEHLLLLGLQNDTVVTQNLGKMKQPPPPL